MAKGHKTNGDFDFGNKLRTKHWKTPEELQAAVDDYFQWVEDNPLEVEESSVGKQVTIRRHRPCTIEGLATHLDVHRATIYNYGDREGYEAYFDIITRAKQKIVNSHIEHGLANIYNAPMTKFILTNTSDYRDRVEQSNDGELTVRIVRE